MKQTNDFEARVTELIEASIVTKQSLLRSTDVVLSVAKVSEVLVNALRQGNKALLFGNGGSRADAHHKPRDPGGPFSFVPPALPAFAFSLTTSAVTPRGNYIGF